LGENNSFFGKKHSEKTRKVLSDKSSGKNNPMYGLGGMLGKKHSEKTKKAQSDARKKFWQKKGVKPKEGFKAYRHQVDILTSKQPIQLLENFENRGKAGVDGAYHLDHIISVWNGYHSGMSPEEISHISNLRFIPWLENQKKWYY
jgi:hypothetical protein